MPFLVADDRVSNYCSRCKEHRAIQVLRVEGASALCHQYIRRCDAVVFTNKKLIAKCFLFVARFARSFLKVQHFSALPVEIQAANTQCASVFGSEIVSLFAAARMQPQRIPPEWHKH